MRKRERKPTGPRIGLSGAWTGTLVALAACLIAGAPGAEDGSSWSHFRGNQALKGVARGTVADKLELRWSFATGGPISSSAVIGHQRVWIGSKDGQIYALDLAEGRKLWSYQTEAAIEAPPLLIAELIVVGSNDGYLYALDALSGVLKWKYQTHDKVVGAANWTRLAQDDRLRILVGSFDHRLHCVDAASGKGLWQYETDNFINGAIAVDGPNAVFGGCDGQLHVVGTVDGVARAKVDVGSYVAASTALRDGRAYLGHMENKVVAVDLANQQLAWEFEDQPFAYFSSPAVDADHVVIGGRDKRLHCIRRRDGHELWSFATEGKVDSSPVICADKVVVGSDDGHLYVVSLRDGKKLWSYRIDRPIASSPAVAAGMIVIGADDGRVYAFGSEP